MIRTIDDNRAVQAGMPEATAVPLSERLGEAVEQEDRASLIEEMTRHIAAQQFIEALLQGEPELTGVPSVSLDGTY